MEKEKVKIPDEGCFIPAYVLYREDLSPIEKILIGKILTFSYNNRCCSSNSHLSKGLGVSKPWVSKLISNLKRKGYLYVEIKTNENKEVIERRITVIRENLIF